MAKRNIPNMPNDTRARVARCDAYAEKVRRMFAATVNDIMRLNLTAPDIEDGEMYSFDGDKKKVQEEVEQLFRRLHSSTVLAIERGISIEWDKANQACDKIVQSVFSKRALQSNLMTGWNARNDAARRAFMSRADNGFDLSARIWKDVRQLREEMEVALTVSLGEGIDSGEASRRVRQYLNDPDLMFRRFRYKIGEKNVLDKEGNIVGKEPVYGRKWKKRIYDEENERYKWIDYDRDSYKVGRGVYKSAAKNAMRVARTETNMAYRTADHERWQQLDFVVGKRISLSKSHPAEDICDTLAGDYPKDFVFVGWHPQCFCMVTPILASEKDVENMNKALLEGKEYQIQTPQIETYPQGFKDWVEDNRDKIETSLARGKAPYFIENNATTITDIIHEDTAKNNTSFAGRKMSFRCVCDDASVKLTPSPIKDISHVEKEILVLLKNNPDICGDKIKGIVAISDETAFANTSDGIIRINFADSLYGFNQGVSLLSAFDKIKKREMLTQHEEYSIEVLWHEILHNKSKNKAVLPPVNSPLGFTRAAMETVNQLVARHSYVEFLGQLGGNAAHYEWILQNGYGYKSTVSNLRKLLDAAKIEEKTFINSIEKELMNDYTDFDSKVGKVLKSLYKGKGDIEWVFNRLELSNFSELIYGELH